jgi:predicted DNA binding protein
MTPLVLEATVGVRIPGCWAVRVATEGSEVRLLDRKAAKGQRVRSLFESIGPMEAPDGIDLFDRIRREPSVRGFLALSQAHERPFGSVECAGCPPYRALVSSDCFLVGAVARRGVLEWTVRFDERKKLARLLRELRRRRFTPEVLRVISLNGKSLLTLRQERVLRSAIRMGYFDFPKRAGVEDVGRAFGVSKSTVSETLHRAERKILNWYLDRHS